MKLLISYQKAIIEKNCRLMYWDNVHCACSMSFMTFITYNGVKRFKLSQVDIKKIFKRLKEFPYHSRLFIQQLLDS